LKRGLLFPARAARLHELWRGHTAGTALDASVRDRVVDRYLAGEHRPATPPAPEGDGRAELAGLFRAYAERGLRLAVTGGGASRVDYLVHCGPAMGAFNQVVEDTELHPWRARTVEAISEVLMEGAAAHVTARLESLAPRRRQSQ
jgi:trans-AT polyketide synthase/acyltransferase/oxidoreductase domain-containing protein